MREKNESNIAIGELWDTIKDIIDDLEKNKDNIRRFSKSNNGRYRIVDNANEMANEYNESKDIFKRIFFPELRWK